MKRENLKAVKINQYELFVRILKIKSRLNSGLNKYIQVRIFLSILNGNLLSNFKQ